MIFNRSFEWAESKERENIRKHGVYFKDAGLVFDDPYCLKRYDCKHSLSENRYQLLGRVGRMLFVVYTLRKNKWIRIISARLATKKERKIYYGQTDKIEITGWRQAYQGTITEDSCRGEKTNSF
ncbi:toxin BrnT [Candidatus Termititenax aidoneus]|uniref:Toxin BrnT n=1 Tax=Termititenax aidoneus TaxID=2218524 RepID=A0A388TBU7_TERA1|nr:toxin BrnT [Candidatus Termititenax aidoneus]